MEHGDEDDFFGQEDYDYATFTGNKEDEQEYIASTITRQSPIRSGQSAHPEDNLVAFTPLHPTEQSVYTPYDEYAASRNGLQEHNDGNYQEAIYNQETIDTALAESSASVANPSASRTKKEKVKKRKAPESSASDPLNTNPVLFDTCSISSLLVDLEPTEVKYIKSPEVVGHVVNCQYPHDTIGYSTIRSQEMSPILANTNRTRESHFQWPFILSMNCSLDGIIVHGVSIVIQKDMREINTECLAKCHISENSIHVAHVKLKKEIRTGEEYTIRFYARIAYSGDSRTFICSWQSHPVLPYCNPQQIPRLISSHYYKNVVKDSHNREASFRETINFFHAKYTREKLKCARYLSEEETRRVCSVYGVDYTCLDNMQHFWEWFIQAMESIYKFIGPKYCEQREYPREGELPSKSNIFDCFITRENAEQKLRGSPPGSLLIRVSTSDVTKIVASFRDEEMFYHYQFNKNMFETSKEEGSPPLLRKIASTPFYSKLDPGSRSNYLVLVTPIGVVPLVQIFKDFSEHILSSRQHYD